MKILITALLLSLGGVGCSSEEPPDNLIQAGDPIGSSDDRAGADDRMLDPVSGEWVRKDAAWRTMYKGIGYFFTSRENAERFASNPTAFVTEDGRIKRELKAR